MSPDRNGQTEISRDRNGPDRNGSDRNSSDRNGQTESARPKSPVSGLTPKLNTFQDTAIRALRKSTEANV